MTKRKFKGLLILYAVMMVGIVAFFYPEHAEAVARALMLIIGVI